MSENAGRRSLWRPAVMVRLSRFRSVAAVTAVTVLASVLVAPPFAKATAAFDPKPLQKVPSVPVTKVLARARTADPATAAAAVPRVAPRWPAPGTATVDLVPPTGVTTTGRSTAGPAVRAGALPVTVRALDDGTTETRTAAGAAPTTRVRVELLDRARTARTWKDSLLIRVSAAAAGTKALVRLSVRYTDFRTAYGADWASRLRLHTLPECALTRPGDADCQPVPLASTNNVGTGEVTADVLVPGATAATLAADTGALLGLTAGPSGPSGDYAATSLQASATWQAGGSSGDFNWSYPLRVPPSAGGPAPSLGLAYSSQSVDGRTDASNNQPSVVGEGFDLSVGGFIERRYKTCADDMGGTANNTVKTGDRCWGTDNASLSMAGHAGELIYNASEGVWHLRRDDGTRVEHLLGAANWADRGEYWKVTTVDGTQYFFGRNQLPGWTQGRPDQESTQYTPVFGNNTGEPCHLATFNTSWCRQVYRWNLDYVVDVHGNSMSLWYTKEFNSYARNANQHDPQPYVRAATLSRIDYGTRADAEFGVAPMRVEFGYADRCDADCATHDGTHWTDTPWDSECAGDPCTNGSPTFWTTRRLATITTRVWGGSAYRDVDRWSLRHTYPDPGDATRAGLWLAGLTRTGLVGGSASLPEITFGGVQLRNRVDTEDDQLPQMNWWRVRSIMNETGGEVTVDYSAPECVAGSHMPVSPESNTMRCGPVLGMFPGDPNKIDWFHKYLVTAVMQTDHTGGGVRTVAAYEYVGTPAWHHDDIDGLTPPDRVSWGQWRGYDRVRVRQGDPGEQTLAETLFYRGMDGDALPGGGVRNAQVSASEGAPVADSDAFAGMPRETIAYELPSMTVVGASISDAWQSAPTASRTVGDETVHSRLVRVSGTRKRLLLDGGRGFQRSSTSTTFGALGLPTALEDRGDDAVAGDERCTRYTYLTNPDAWLMVGVSRIQTLALRCDQSPTSAADVISDVRSSFDGRPWGIAPTLGDITTSESISAWSTGTATYLTTRRWAYDAYGRVTDTWDALGNRSTTAYTPASGAPITAITTTNALMHRETATNEPAWGQPLSTTDANGKRTDLVYDPLGHLTKVWQPGRTKDVDQPNYQFGYTIRNDGATVVTTKTLNPAGAYVTSYKLYDALMRERQTQSPSPVAGGRIVADRFYDSQGRVSLTYNPYYNSSPPGPDLVRPINAGLVPSQTRTVFDGVGRETATIFQPGGTEKWRVSTTYGGDHIDQVPPLGSSATSVRKDIRGNAISLRQYHGNTVSGTPDVTTYTYGRQGLLEKVVDPAGNTWRSTYDLRGRVISTSDPDTGVSQLAYNNADQVTLSTDARQVKIAYKYDALGRITATHDNSLTGTQRTGWTYDTLAKGYPTASTRYDSAGNAYTITATGYTDRYQPTGQTVSIPAVEGTALARDYTFGLTYNTNGSLKETSLPAVGGLAAEKLKYGYDALGLPSTLTATYAGATTSYVASTSFSELGDLLQIKRSTGTGGSVYQDFTYETDTRRLHQNTVSRTAVAPNVVRDVTYTYDNSGNLIKAVDAPPSTAPDTQCYKQDYLSRLVEAWTPASGTCGTPTAAGLGGPAPYWHSFTYDVTGNRRTQVEHAITGDTTTSYTQPAAGAGQPHTLTSSTTVGPGGTSNRNYSYDPTGNTLTRPGTTTGTQQNLTWDAEGKLSSLTESGASTTYLYAANGDRLLRRDPTTVTLYLGSTELRLTRTTGALSATRYYQHAGQPTAVRTPGAGVCWLLADPQGTASIAITASNQQAQIRRQAPFGTPRGSQPPSWPGERGFVGGDQDPTGLTHLGAREYDPATGRFISADPLLNIGDPQQMHGYAYANNDPVNRSDPSGLMLSGVDWGDLWNSTSDTIVEYGTLAICAGVITGTPILAVFVASIPMICGGLAGAAVYMNEVLRGDHDFDLLELLHAVLVGAALEMGGELLADALHLLASAIKAIGGETFGRALDKIVSLLEGKASAADPPKTPSDPALTTPDRPTARGRGENPMPKDPPNTAPDNATSTAGDKPSTNDTPSTETDAGGSSNPSCLNSFDPATPVLLADGSVKPIDDIAVGDQVLATNPETGESRPQPVRLLHDNLDTDLSDVTVVTATGVVTLHTTQAHPFWDDTDRSWVYAGSLRPGHRLRTPDGVVTVHEVLNRAGAARMLNLTVANLHTYYVLAGNTPVLVHNSNCWSTTTENAGDLAGKYTPGQSTRDPASQWYHEELSNEDLLNSINNAAEGDGIVVSRNGTILGGHHRWDELMARIADGRIDPNAPINIQIYG
ncbi:RHS repeat-associated protein [Allocatelliglobosispora scoriae]|uniref:RHS repeat-associated protein n=1 Tax=Allocatelliglobosispora scoriae TaxID=643052 RepID=A0A841BN88_9ACTN|nr:RHS repeat-associated core domain-containing protein [Allocatelliglobosispora scoriae]MBB5868280.1 RHS repeat-associated protein [Allocatelliglobosispora scoriae]